MTRLALLRQLWQHSTWADDELFRALTGAPASLDHVWREYQHILGAEEIWLSRLEQRGSRVGVWPTLSRDEAGALRQTLTNDYATFLLRLSDSSLEHSVSYTTSDGRPFTNVVGDILAHVAMHGQYHRGKVNLLLRQAEVAPAPVDYITFIRGAPTATQASAAARRESPDASSTIPHR
jgi:uncharacterized damage-inducible protein DinB